MRAPPSRYAIHCQFRASLQYIVHAGFHSRRSPIPYFRTLRSSGRPSSGTRSQHRFLMSSASCKSTESLQSSFTRQPPRTTPPPLPLGKTCVEFGLSLVASLKCIFLICSFGPSTSSVWPYSCQQCSFHTTSGVAARTYSGCIDRRVLHIFEVQRTQSSAVEDRSRCRMGRQYIMYTVESCTTYLDSLPEKLTLKPVQGSEFGDASG